MPCIRHRSNGSRSICAIGQSIDDALAPKEYRRDPGMQDARGTRCIVLPEGLLAENMSFVKSLFLANRYKSIQIVEIPRFELGQTEPKSVVLPLHHISIPGAKLLLFYFFAKRHAGKRFQKRPATRFQTRKRANFPTRRSTIVHTGLVL